MQLNNYYAVLLPDQKVEKVEELLDKTFDDYTVKLLREERLNEENCYLVEGIAKNDKA